MLSLRKRTSVNDHRKPPQAEAVMTAINLTRLSIYAIPLGYDTYPTNSNSVSSDTMSSTPTMIIKIIPISLMLGFSRRNKNAKTNTNASVEDLHMA